MNEIITSLSKVGPLGPLARQDFLSAFSLQLFSKGSFLIKPHHICNHYYFVKSGLIKSFFYKGDKEFIMTFFYEAMFFTEFESYVSGQPAKYMLKALEDTSVYAIHKRDILNLCKTHQDIEALFSKLYSLTALKMMKRISEMLEENATERYKLFIADNNQLLQRISLGDLSNYLGITQVSLSRIRASR